MTIQPYSDHRAPSLYQIPQSRPWDSKAHIIANCFGEIPAASTLTGRVSKVRPNLETLLKSEYLLPVNILSGGECDFMEPNEGGVIAVQPLLDQAFGEMQEPSYLIAVGGERAFFALCLAKNCKGLIIRDINSRMKAYVDFIILLLRLCKDRAEFVSLSSSAKNKEIIRQKLQQNREISLDLKAYYEKHFDDFAKIYYQFPWRTKLKEVIDSHNPCKGADYYYDDGLFAKLQGFAKAGEIIATEGNISNLKPFHNLSVAAIDISNIHDYEFVPIEWPRDVHVIWTKSKGTFDLRFPCEYFSHKTKPISEGDKNRCSELIKSLMDSGDIRVIIDVIVLPQSLGDEPPFYCHKFMDALQKYRDEHCIYSDTLGWLSGESLHTRKICDAEIKDLRILSKHPEIKKLAPHFVKKWDWNSFASYWAMTEAEGWKEAFLEEMISQEDPCFFAWVARHALYFRLLFDNDNFPTDTSSENLQDWAQSLRKKYVLNTTAADKESPSV